MEKKSLVMSLYVGGNLILSDAILMTSPNNVESLSVETILTPSLTTGSLTIQSLSLSESKMMVLVGGTNNNDSIKSSVDDGVTWTACSSGGFTTYGNGVAWNGSIWVATGIDTLSLATIKHSSDGLIWLNSISGGFSSAGNGVAWNGSMWVATGTDSSSNNTIKYSLDGSNWSNSISGGFTTQGNGVAWNGSM